VTTHSKKEENKFLLPMKLEDCKPDDRGHIVCDKIKVEPDIAEGDDLQIKTEEVEITPDISKVDTTTVNVV